MDDRNDLAKAFVGSVGWGDAETVFLAGDASARRYFRLFNAARETCVLMDDQSGDPSSMTAFLMVAAFLRDNKFSAPRVLAQDLERGFLLLEDFGNALVAKVVSEDPNQEQNLYQASTDVLVSLEGCEPPKHLEVFGPGRLAAMIAPCFDWYKWAATGETGNASSAQVALEEAMASLGGKVVALRDYHAENLIYLPHRSAASSIGLLDFQDAFVGPWGYDLVSLLQDARRDVSVNTQQATTTHFAEQTGRTLADIHSAMAILGTQRNLRILGIFVRLAIKLGKPRYLDFLPRVWRYVEQNLTHPALCDVRPIIERELPKPSPALISDLKSRCGTVQTQ